MIGIGASILLISSSVINPQDVAKLTPCDDGGRYERAEAVGGGARISEASACNMINAFTQRTGFNRGGFISKKALDKLFTGNTNNGINFYFAMDANSESKIVKLVIEGAHQSTTQTETLSVGDRYISQIICPPACSASIFDKCK